MADDVDVSMDVDVNQVVMDRLNSPLNVEVESKHFCTDCEDEIPEERRKYKNVTLCVMCQTRVEKAEALKLLI